MQRKNAVTATKARKAIPMKQMKMIVTTSRVTELLE